jgi:cell division protein ZapA
MTTNRKNAVRLVIAGEEFSIRSDAPPEHTQAVADYVNQAVRRILSSGPIIESHKAAVMAAMQIADDLFRVRAEAEELTNSLRALSDDVRRLLPPAKRQVTPPSLQSLGRDSG